VPVSRLTLTDFRSYAAATIAPGPGFVLLSGENGAGKTNVLEAVSLLTPGRGLRGAALSELSRQSGNGAFAVAASLTLPLDGGGQGGAAVTLPETSPHPNPSPSRGGAIQIGTGTLPAAPERRQIIAITHPMSALEQRATDAALFERTRADGYEVALRGALINLEQGSVAIAKAQIRIALLK